MREMLLIVTILGVFMFGYFLMGRLDHLLNENRRTLETKAEAKEPSCVLLTEEASDEEIAEEIRRFRSSHAAVRIFLCDAAAAHALEEFHEPKTVEPLATYDIIGYPNVPKE